MYKILWLSKEKPDFCCSLQCRRVGGGRLSSLYIAVCILFPMNLHRPSWGHSLLHVWPTAGSTQPVSSLLLLHVSEHFASDLWLCKTFPVQRTFELFLYFFFFFKEGKRFPERGCKLIKEIINGLDILSPFWKFDWIEFLKKKVRLRNPGANPCNRNA